MASKRNFLIGAALLSLVAVLGATASYPGLVKSFSTKLAGQTVSSAHINDIQDEIVAIEGALLNGFTHALKPSSTGGADLGTASLPWGTIYVNTINGLSADQTCGRLTLTSGTPRTTADVTAATSIYYTPDGCDGITLYDGSTRWQTRTFTELTLAVPATTSTLYDVWIYDNAGVAAIEALAWTNDTTRATALVRQDGRWVKSGATTRRYVGSFRTTAVSGQTEDSGFSCTTTKRYVWNYYNRIRRPLCRIETTASWTYAGGATFHQANAEPANQVDVVIGLADAVMDLSVTGVGVETTSGNLSIVVAIGEDSTTTAVSGQTIAPGNGVSGTNVGSATAHLFKMPAIGRHFYAWLEAVQAGGSTWRSAASVAGARSGLLGWIEG